MRAAVVVATVLGLLGGSVLVAGPAWATYTSQAAIAVGTSPVGVTFNPAGTKGYVAVSGMNKITVVDRATGSLLTPISTCSGPMGIVFTPITGATAYVPCYSDGVVWVIDVATGTRLQTINVGTAPFFIAMSPDGSKAYVANSGGVSGTVSVIDTATATVSATIPVGLAPVAVAFNPAGTRAYVANSAQNALGNSVTVINVLTSTVVTTTTVTGVPYGVAVSPDGLSVYVSRVNGLKVSIISTASNLVTAMLTLTSKPEGVTFSPNGKRVYLPTQGGNIAVIDAATQTLLPSIPSGSGSRIMAFTPDGTLAYVTNNISGTISVIAFDNTLPTITGTPAGGTSGATYSFAPAVTGPGVTVSVQTGTLPPGLSLAAGVISGTPTTAGSYPVTLRATNDNGFVDLSVTFAIALPTYSVSFDAAGGSPTPGTQTITSGQLATAPSAPTRPAYTFDGWWNGVTRWNFGTNTVTAAVALTAHWLLSPTITGASSADAPLGAPFSWTPTIAGVVGYSVTSTGLPAGLTLASGTGIISGTPTGPLTATPITLTVADANGTATFPVTITVTHGAAQSLAITPSDATPNQGDTITLTVSALDSQGNAWDVSGTATITSNVGTDVIVGTQVTFPHASPHLLTATVAGATGSSLIQVTASQPGLLGFTGGTVAFWLVPWGLGVIAVGIGLLAARARRGRHRRGVRAS